MISCLSQRETFMRDLFIKTHEHQIYTLCTTTMMMDMALILFKWSRWMMTFISLVKCCSNIIEYSSTQKGPRKVSSFTAVFFPFWNSWDYYVFFARNNNWCTNFEIFFLCPWCWSFGFWHHHPWEISNREAVSVQSVFTISMCNISLIVDRLPNMFSRKTRFFLRYLSTSSVSGFSNDV